MDDIHFSSAVLSVVGALVGVLLGLIAYFLDRLIKQFDKLSAHFDVLNTTMLRIDKDLSGDVVALKTENSTMKERVKNLDVLFDRVRAVENDVAIIKTMYHADRKVDK